MAKKITHAKSILSEENACFICGRPYPLHKHHIYGGGARLISEENGFWCYLCHDHHIGDHGVHRHEEENRKLKALCQAKYEETHSREEFMDLIGRNYMED